MDQRSLVERAQRGNHDAFAALADAAAGRLLGAASLILRDHELAQDATQDALVRAWRDLPGLRDPDRFDAWLHRITVNSCLDLARRRRRRPLEVELDGFDRALPVDIAAQQADHDVLARALRGLEPAARAVVVLHYYLGLPISEVATTLGIPEGTAKSRLNRSLATMRSVVDDADIAQARAPEGQPA